MAQHESRRKFLADVGRSMVVAGIGWQAGCDMGFSERAFAEVSVLDSG